MRTIVWYLIHNTMSTIKYYLNTIRTVVDAIGQDDDQNVIKSGLAELLDKIDDQVKNAEVNSALDFHKIASEFVTLDPMAHAVSMRLPGTDFNEIYSNFGKNLIKHIYDVQYAGPISQSLLIEACKYGYEYHATTSFPEHTFEEEAINNFKQELTTWDMKPNLVDQIKSLFADEGDMYLFTKKGDMVMYEKIGDLVRTDPKNHEKSACIEFLDSIRDYERECGDRICNDERDSETLYDIYTKKIPASSY